MVLPIGSAEVRAGVDRELRSLAELATFGPTPRIGAMVDIGSGALARAFEITAAKIRNSPVLIECQADLMRCHVCNDPLDGTRPEIAILQTKPGKHLWLHHGDCHEAHGRRRTVLVDEIMRAAGYGPDQQVGEAA